MKVVFAPDWSDGNPYQNNLAYSLSKKGVKVCYEKNLRNLYHYIKRGKFDILHLHWQHPLLLASNQIKTILKSTSSVTTLAMLRIAGIKIVWTIHNITSHERNNSSLELFLCRIIARLCSKIIAHSSSARIAIIDAYRIQDSLVTTIPHGNYLANYSNNISESEARQKLGLSLDNIVFLYFGAVRGYKGIPELVEAFKRMDEPKSRLIIAGRPSSKEEAQEILEKCQNNDRITTVFEFIPDQDVQLYMNAANVVVLPFKNILTSGSAMLAISFAKPVIAPLIGCIPDILDSKGSILYDPSKSDGLLNAMKLAFHSNLEKMGKYNFKVAEKFNWDDIAEKTSYVYHECLKK